MKVDYCDKCGKEDIEYEIDEEPYYFNKNLQFDICYKCAKELRKWIKVKS